MILFNFKEYNLKFIERDVNLNLKVDQGLISKTKNFIFLEFFWVFTENHSNNLKHHYNILLLYFFFFKKIYLNSIKQGRSNKVSFFILNFNFNLVQEEFMEFLNFFYFDFLRFFFFLGEKFFGKVLYKTFYINNFFFFRLFDFDLFFNKRLSNKLPLFFPNIDYPINFRISWNYNFLYVNKIFNKL